MNHGLNVLQLLYKTVRSVLNKITPQKLDVLIDKVLALDIDTEERLDGCINILFEKVQNLFLTKVLIG